MRTGLKRTAKQGLRFLPLKLRRNALFLLRQGRLLPRQPQTFSEKIQWRILYDRRPLIAVGGDKIEMKEHAKRSSPRVLIPETLWNGIDLVEVYEKDWGCEWVLKPISGSGYALFGSGSLASSGVDLTEIAKWRYADSFTLYGEWAYGQARPGYLIERRIETDTGLSPNDVRLFVFNGRVKILQIDSPRINEVRRRFYTPEWEALPFQQGGKRLADVQPRPDLLDEMISIAEEIGRQYDFIRVDLYETQGKLYFGEITPYPTGGLGKYNDVAFDRVLGDYWELPLKGSSFDHAPG